MKEKVKFSNEGNERKCGSLEFYIEHVEKEQIDISVISTRAFCPKIP